MTNYIACCRAKLLSNISMVMHGYDKGLLGCAEGHQGDFIAYRVMLLLYIDYSDCLAEMERLHIGIPTSGISSHTSSIYFQNHASRSIRC